MPDLLENATPGRLYPIAPGESGWNLYYPGRLPDGTQAILGTLPHRGPPLTGTRPVSPLVGLFFSPDGHFVRQEIVHVPFTVEPDWPPFRQLAFEKNHRAEARMRWMAELGMNVDSVKLLYFFLPDFLIGLADWPNHLFRERCAVMRQEGDLSVIEVEDDRHREWIEGGHFVFYWGNSFFMNQDGTVGST
jgi:hypothetical protein